MLAEAKHAFPNETGGVLIGYWAVLFQEIVLTTVVGPGPHAIHGTDSFMPDSEYQEAEIARYYHASGRLHTYLGDWHTHPNSSPRMSRIDRKTLKNIAGDPDARTPVPIMAILAGGKPWTLRVWRGDPIWIGPMMATIRACNLTVKMFQP